MKKKPFLVYWLAILLLISGECAAVQSEQPRLGGIEFVGNPEGICVQIGENYLLELEECDARLLRDDKGKRTFLLPEGTHRVLFFRDGIKVGEQLIEVKRASVTTIEIP